METEDNTINPTPEELDSLFTNEIGFYHPSVGYWQAIAGVTPEILESYPEGTMQVPLIPGSNYEWKDNQWVEKPVEPIVYTDEEIKSFRAAAYIREADPIFFKYQRGEATENDWTSKVQEIRDRYPYNTPPQQQEEE
jgi:hypothetical protein